MCWGLQARFTHGSASLHLLPSSRDGFLAPWCLHCPCPPSSDGEVGRKALAGHCFLPGPGPGCGLLGGGCLSMPRASWMRGAAPGALAQSPPGTAHLLTQEPAGRWPFLRASRLLWGTQRAWWEGEVEPPSTWGSSLSACPGADGLGSSFWFQSHYWHAPPWGSWLHSHISGWNRNHKLCWWFRRPAVWPRGLEPARLLCLWNTPSKNPAVGCHFLLQENRKLYWEY